MTAEERLALALASNHPDAAARVLEHAGPADAAAVLSGLPAATGAEVFRFIGPTPSAACAAVMADDSLAAIIDALPLDMAGVAMRRVEPGRRAMLLMRMPGDRASPLQRMLTWPDDSAGALADPMVQSLADDITAAEALRRLRSSTLHVFADIYVVDRDGVLVGAVPASKLMTARQKAPLAELTDRSIARLDAFEHLTSVAAHPAWRSNDALPVVDGQGRLVGGIRHMTVRQLSVTPGRPMMETIVGLSELYWAGLTGILASLRPPSTEENDDVT